jgi:alpha-tubulin suppressor-like RCC1 family protein
VSPGTVSISATSEGRTAAAQLVVRAPFTIADVRRRVVSGFEQSCAIGSNGSTYCWGWERYGAIGNGREEDNFRTTADAVTGGPSFTSLAGGYSHMCGLSASGAAWCWGKATLGQIGNGTQVNASTPVAVSGGHAFTQLSAGGSDRTCGVTSAGEIWCWGSNNAGSLGAGAAGVGSTVPVRVAGARTYRQVMVGSGGACALRDDGAAFCWGANSYGQLGNGTTGGSSSVPVAVSGTHRFVELIAGFGHYCGRTMENAVWCWGFNSLGQLGDGSQVNRAAPVQASVGTTLVTLASGSVTTCGTTSSGSAFCWGGGSYGILGNGDTSVFPNFTLAPVAVQGGLPFGRIDGGGNGALCGVTLTNAVYCWGNGTYGNLGNGTRGQVGVPAAVVGLP